jgi:uncharacterized protein (DUF4415 family)
MKKRRPYTRRLKRPVTLRLEAAIIQYFHKLAEEHGMPYQTLINLYLRDCVRRRKRPNFDWNTTV